MKIKNATFTENDQEFATYTLKIPKKLYTKFKIKSLTEKDATFRETLTKIIERYVST